MKLIDKPLTTRQKKFCHLYVIDGGMKSNTEIAIESGYPKSSAYHRTCLLYTSPSPRDGLLSRMPSSA